MRRVAPKGRPHCGRTCRPIVCRQGLRGSSGSLLWNVPGGQSEPRLDLLCCWNSQEASRNTHPEGGGRGIPDLSRFRDGIPVLSRFRSHRDAAVFLGVAGSRGRGGSRGGGSGGCCSGGSGGGVGHRDRRRDRGEGTVGTPLWRRMGARPRTSVSGGWRGCSRAAPSPSFRVLFWALCGRVNRVERRRQRWRRRRRLRWLRATFGCYGSPACPCQDWGPHR